MATATTERILGSQRQELANELRRKVSGEVNLTPFPGFFTALMPAFIKWNL